MIRNFSMIMTVITVVLVSYGIIIIYWDIENGKVCDELVIMNDGSQIEATKVTTYENGMSYIHQCNGEQVEIPTINIKMIKEIKSLKK